MGYALRTGLSCCSVADRLLFLDIDRDRYFALAPPTEKMLQKLLARRPLDAMDEQKLQALIDSGVIVITVDPDQSVVPCPPLPAPETSLLDRPGAPRTTFGTLAAALAITVSLYRVKHRPLRQNLEAAVAQRRELGRATENDLSQMGWNYHRAGRLITTHDRCLAQSLALMRAITGKDGTAKLVLGVMLGPFAAHCWVQHGRTVVNDYVDRVRCYTPILVL